ncbi:MAG: lasso peptide biosynthesis B2 protein [Woeseiaceae bacterium]
MASVDMVAASAAPPEQVARIKVPSVLRGGLMIFAVKASLKACGFAATIKYIRRRMEVVPQSGGGAVEAVRATEHAVAMAGAFYPGRALCLEQSLVLYYLLRRQGVAVKYCHGIQAHPFAAHAWVEYGGVAINDVPERVKPFTPLPALLP